MRMYKGKYKVKIIQHLGKKCVVETLEQTVIGNPQCGHETIKKGKRFITMTRMLYRCG